MSVRHLNAIAPLVLWGACFFIAVLLAPATAQAETLYEEIPEHIKESRDSIFSFTIENDLFGNGQDRNYTNGARFSYFDRETPIPNSLNFISDLVPTFDINDTTSLYYSFGQNLYTPEIITTAIPDPTDRPYAAFLYGSAGLTSVSGNHIDDMEVTLGVVGPWALGETVQDSVHHLINADNPSGWDYQLENEPGLILSWERQWIYESQQKYLGLNARFIPHGGVTLGNVYTYANSGFTIHLTPERYKWQSLPPRVRPAIPGNGFFAVQDHHFAWSLFAGVDGRAVGRNIFLDGNSFRDSPSVDKKYFVGDANAGLALTYGRTQISYTLNWRTREFREQNDQSLFGAISIGYRF